MAKFGEWTKVSDGLPETDGRYLVHIGLGVGEILIMSFALDLGEADEDDEFYVERVQNPVRTYQRLRRLRDTHTSEFYTVDWDRDDYGTADEICMMIWTEYVNAWMPLPEPYRNE